MLKVSRLCNFPNAIWASLPKGHYVKDVWIAEDDEVGELDNRSTDFEIGGRRGINFLLNINIRSSSNRKVAFERNKLT